MRLTRAEGLGVGGKRLDVSAERRNPEHRRDGALAAHSFLQQLSHLQGYAMGSVVREGGGGRFGDLLTYHKTNASVDQQVWPCFIHV
jgi:hypothetical protein